MLTKLKLTNFKPFGSQDRPSSKREARLAPITLIYGPNSSGKSSISQSLRMIAQTIDWLESSPEQIHESDLLTSENSANGVDLGNFVSVIHKHEKDKEVTIELTLRDQQASSRVFDTNFCRQADALVHRISLTYSRKKHLTTGNSADDSVAILSKIAIQTTSANARASSTENSRQDEMSCLLVLERGPSPRDRNDRNEGDLVSIHDDFYITENTTLTSLAEVLTPTINERRALFSEYQRSDRYNPAPTYFRSDDTSFDPADIDTALQMDRKEVLKRKLESVEVEVREKKRELRVLERINDGGERENVIAKSEDRLSREALREIDVLENRIRNLTFERDELRRELSVLAKEELNQPNVIRNLREKVSFTNYGVKMFSGLRRSLLPIAVSIEKAEGMYREIDSSRRLHADSALFEIFACRIQAYLSHLEQLLTRSLNTMRYVPPLRPAPKRIYSTKELHIDPTILVGINKQLKALEIGYQIDFRKISDEVLGDAVALEIVNSEGVRVALTDVGFGISQLLPILREGIRARSDKRVIRENSYRSRPTGQRSHASSIVIVEQPELHLHPRLQANLADFFIECSGISISNEDDGQKNVQWLIESHSETLLLRLKRRIREKKIRASDICILYVYEDEVSGSSRILEIELSDDGEFLTEWPDGFFDENFREIFSSEQ